MNDILRGTLPHASTIQPFQISTVRLQYLYLQLGAMGVVFAGKDDQLTEGTHVATFFEESGPDHAQLLALI